MASYLLLARHGSVRRDPELLEPEQPLDQAGETVFAEVAQIVRATFDVDGIRLKEIRYSGYRHARQTAEIMASALERGGLKSPTSRWPTLEPSAFWTSDKQETVRGLSEQLRAELIAMAAAPEGSNAVMLVGHQPQLDWIGHTLLRGRNLPISRSEVACLEFAPRNRGRGLKGRVLWMVSPSDPETSAALREKVKGKMDTAKTLGGVLIFVLGFALSVLVDTGKLQHLENPSGSLTCAVGCLGGRLGLIPPPGLYLTIFQVSVALLFVALGLYLACMYAYDRLLMPSRFWTERPDGHTPGWMVRRPPSSSTWIIFLNMMRTWSITFTRATIAVVTGLAGVAAAVLRLDPVDLLVLVPIIVAASLSYLRFARPRLGAED